MSDYEMKSSEGLGYHCKITVPIKRKRGRENDINLSLRHKYLFAIVCEDETLKKLLINRFRIGT